MNSDLLKTKKLQSLKKIGQIIWTKISSFIRRQIIWIRIIAFFKFLLLYNVGAAFFWWLIDGRGVFIRIMIFVLSQLVALLGAIGLWSLTTKLLRHKKVILLLYIPGFFLIIPMVAFLFHLDVGNETMNIAKVTLRSVFMIFELFILACFWNRTISK